MKALSRIVILLSIATCSAQSQYDDCPDWDIEYANCTSEQRCVSATTCSCIGGDYRVTDTLSCDGRCAIAREVYCEDIGMTSKSPITDLCDYAAGDICVDKCIFALNQCSCGGEEFNIRDSQTFCCNGIQQSINQPCISSISQTASPSSCYNSYQDSEHIGYSSHFSCPDVCVPILDMCQGMSWCTEDVAVCDEKLKIPRAIPLRPKYIYYYNLVVML